MRVVSLLPSATEVLCAIGGESLLVGRSHECDHPASVSDRPVLTSARTQAITSAEIDAEVRATLGSEEAPSLYHLDVDRLVDRGVLRLDSKPSDFCEFFAEFVKNHFFHLEP